MSDETTLLSCPFCGGEADIRRGDNGKWYIDTLRCVNVYTPHHAYVIADTKAEAIAAWNARAYLNPDGLPVGLTLSEDGALLNWRGENYVKQSTLGGGVCENISDPPEGFLCSSCGWGDFAEPSHLLTSAKYTGRVGEGPNFCPNCGKAVER